MDVRTVDRLGQIRLALGASGPLTQALAQMLEDEACCPPGTGSCGCEPGPAGPPGPAGGVGPPGPTGPTGGIFLLDLTALAGSVAVPQAVNDFGVLELVGEPAGAIELSFNAPPAGQLWTVQNAVTGAAEQKIMIVSEPGDGIFLPRDSDRTVRGAAAGNLVRAAEGAGLGFERVLRVNLAGGAGVSTDVHVLELPQGRLLTRALVVTTAAAVSGIPPTARLGTTVGGQEILLEQDVPVAWATLGLTAGEWGGSFPNSQATFTIDTPLWLRITRPAIVASGQIELRLVGV